VVNGNAWEHADELVAADTSDHVVGTQASSEGVGHGDEQRVARSMTPGVVRRFEAIYVDIRSDQLSAYALSAIDLAHDGCQSGAAAAYPGQLVGPGIFAVPGSLSAIFRGNLAVEAALCAIVRRHLAVVDRSDPAVRGISALRGSPGSGVLRPLAIARRAISRGSVEITGRVVARFGLSVAQPGRYVTVPRRQPSLPAAHRGQLVGPGILAVPRGLCAIFGCNFAVIDGTYAAVGSLGPPRVGQGALVSRALTVAGRVISCSSVAITRCVVTRFGLSVAQPGRHVTIPRRKPSLPAAHSRQLVGPGILAILRRLSAIVRCDLAIVDGSFAAVRGIGAARVRPGAFICRAPAVARRAIRRGSVELTRRVVTRFGVPVTLLGGEVTRPRSEARTFAILRSLRAIFCRQPPVVDGLGAVIRSLGAPRGGLRPFVCGAPAIARRAVSRGSVKVARRVVTPFGLSVTQPGRDVTVLSGQSRHTTARARELVGPGIVAVLGGLGTIFGRHPAIVDRLGAVVGSPGAPRGGLVTLVCRMLTVRRRAIPSRSVEIAGGVITSFGLSVTQPRRDVTVLRGQAGLPAPDSCQLVGPGILAVLGGLGAIFGRHPAVVDSLGPVVRSLGPARGRSGTLAVRLLTISRRPVACGPVEVARRVITRRGLPVALLRHSVAHVRGQIAVAPFDVALACLGQGVLARIRPIGVLIWEFHASRPPFRHMSPDAKRWPVARTNAATVDKCLGALLVVSQALDGSLPPPILTLRVLCATK
jgi:hypothetical protein